MNAVVRLNRSIAARITLLLRRLLAFLLDWLLIALYIVFLVAVVLLVSASPLRSAYGRLFTNPNSAEATAFVMLVLPVLLYFARFESSGWRATPGKRRIGLMVETIGGSQVSFPRAIARNLLKLIPWELAHASIWRIPGVFTGGLGSRELPIGVQLGLVSVYLVAALFAISAVVTPRGQTLYDLLSGTIVSTVEPGRRDGLGGYR